MPRSLSIRKDSAAGSDGDPPGLLTRAKRDGETMAYGLHFQSMKKERINWPISRPSDAIGTLLTSPSLQSSLRNYAIGIPSTSTEKISPLTS